jgi:peroxiredoxin
VVLAAVFLTAGVGKLLDLQGSGEAAAGFGVPERLAPAVGVLLPVLELCIGVALLISAVAWGGALAALALLLVFAGVIARSMLRGEAPDCHCFGQIHSAPAGPATLIRNLVLAVAAAFVVAHGPGSVGTSATAWIAKLSSAQAMALAALLIAGILLLAGGVFVLELLRQHGRTLVRLDQLEQELGAAGIPMPDAPGTVQPQGPPAGLPVGSAAPDFELPDVDGAPVTLSSLLADEQPVMLVFTDPNCGPCQTVLPMVAEWQSEHADVVTIAVVSEGEVQAIRDKRDELGLHSVLVQHEREVAETYEAYGTPAAVLISSEGVIASPLGTGSTGVPPLMDQLLGRPLEVIPPAPAGGSISAGGIPVGEEAPSFELPTLAGGTVSLQSLRGHPTALIFWNPGCGFCGGMASQLTQWWEHRDETHPEVLLLSRGAAEEHNGLVPLERIAVDESFELGSRFNANGTPMGVLIDADGRVASGVAAGAEAVFALLSPRQEAVARA